MGQIESQYPDPAKDALLVAQSKNIMDELTVKFPRVVEQLNHNRSATISLLLAKGIISTYIATGEFKVRHISNDNLKNLSEYREIIQNYIISLCQQLRNEESSTLIDQLEPARAYIATYIQQEYYNKLPRWPSVGDVQTAIIKLHITGSYRFEGKLFIWCCIGSIEVKDKRVEHDVFKVLFSGNPEIKALILNLDKLKELDQILESGSFDESAKMIEQKYNEKEGRENNGSKLEDLK